MSKQNFPVTEAEVKTHKTGGTANITVTVDGVTLPFLVTDVYGYLSWAGIDGKSPSSIRIHYGRDLEVGTHPLDASLMMLTYQDANGNERYRPTSGQVEVTVHRPEFGTEFKHVGKLVDVKYGDQSPVIILNGTYEVGEYEPD
ncbi:hypothetical protein ACW9I8_19375 [Pseudomonas reactans]